VKKGAAKKAKPAVKKIAKPKATGSKARPKKKIKRTTAKKR